MRCFFLAVFVFFHVSLVAQEELRSRKRVQTAIRVDHAPKIDGVLDENLWNTQYERTSFIQYAPDNGAPSTFETAVQVIYTDKALYIAARLFDPEPSKILKEFGGRDDMWRNTDRFGIMIDPYNSGISAFTFFVTAAGVQGDFYLTGTFWDGNWDAVWNSAVSINENGWTAEIEIPYYAIRFPRLAVQEWGINYFRSVKRIQEEAYWNHIDNSIQGVVNQSGILKGIENIEPPLRLSFSPYLTASYNHSEEVGDGQFSLTGGMDLKYGINESYTLDMSLIPDFSQVQSDNVVLNLSAYEVRFAENRQFFTEGTELFNKGSLFYSRRVGSTFGEIEYDDQHEEIASQPTAANLLNATKISGRNKKGLGLGFFNAITNKTKALIRNKENGTTREVDVDPVTNFNVVVVDQNLKNNSNFNFTNTNVARANGGRDANVAGASLSLNDRTLRYRVRVFGSVSNIARRQPVDTDGNETGFKYTVELAKVSGPWQYGISRNVESKNYQINDLGYLRAPNEISHYAYARFNVFKPFGIFNRLNAYLSLFHDQLFAPRAFSTFDVNASTYAQFRNFWSIGFGYGMKPVTSHDYFEPRTEGYFVALPASRSYNVSLESDSRKPLKGNFYGGRWVRDEWDQHSDWMGIYLRYRVSNKLSLNVEVNGEESVGGRGYVANTAADAEEQIIFGQRNVKTATNVAGINYTFNNRMGVNLRVRHYWSSVKYETYYKLEREGSLIESNYSGVDDNGELLHDTNFNALNLDLVYSLQVAPGSFVNVVWKDAIQSLTTESSLDYFSSYRQALQAPQTNNVSIRFTYFLDYLTLRKSVSRS